jgi:CxxC motif-containing protein (DUF1111 family)
MVMSRFCTHVARTLWSVRPRRLSTQVLTVALLAFATAIATTQDRQGSTRVTSFTANGGVSDEGPAGGGRNPTEAPAAFDNRTNGFDPQGRPFDEIDEDTVEPLASFNDNRFIFEEFETVDDGLGPTYNAQSCRECHQNPVTGAAAQISEHRAGRRVNGRFVEAAGGTLIHSRAIHPDVQENLGPRDDVETFRIATNTLGDGFVEAIANSTLLAIRDSQPSDMRGKALAVAVTEKPGITRIGRFGWKNQHASLLSFSADAYLNEMGITTPFQPVENTSNGRSVAAFDSVADPEDDGIDAVAFAQFMRSTKAPPRGAITDDVRGGATLFDSIGCDTCHVSRIVTAPAGTVIVSGSPFEGGDFTVPRALGSKIIHPFSDFLLHNIGTGDGIPVDADPDNADTANQMRTAPLWGLRMRNRLMHDGLSFSLVDAIQRHRGQADKVRLRFWDLSSTQRDKVLKFLQSL